MGFAKSHNHSAIFSISTEGFEYKKLTDFELGKKYLVRGCFVHEKGKYGESCSLILDDCFMNLPSHMVNDCKDILANKNAIAQIEASGLYAEVYEYEDTKNTHKMQRSIRWIDAPEFEDVEV